MNWLIRYLAVASVFTCTIGGSSSKSSSKSSKSGSSKSGSSKSGSSKSGSSRGEACQENTITTLDLFNSKVADPGTTDNDLQDDGRLVFRNAGKVKQTFGPDKKLSLIVTKRPGTKYFSNAAGNPADDVSSNGKNGKFGSINIKYNPTEEFPDQIGEGKFNFCVVDADTEEPVPLDFNFFFFDIDNRSDMDGKKGLQERVEVFGYDQILETEVNPKKYNLNEKNDKAIVKGTTVTEIMDNPVDPNDLDNDQLAKSIGFSFKSTSCFKVNFLLKCPNNGNNCRTGGANILFTGEANQIFPEPCPTTSLPTLGPTIDPTEVPTTGPTIGPTVIPTIGPTIGPTVDPTVGPTFDPTAVPTIGPTAVPTIGPTFGPTAVPTIGPTFGPTAGPTIGPTVVPSASPTIGPTITPTDGPTNSPTQKECPLLENVSHNTICGPADNMILFLGQDSQCVTSGLTDDGGDPFFDIDFPEDGILTFRVKNPFALGGGKLFVYHSAPVVIDAITGAVATSRQCHEVEGCLSETLEATCSTRSDSLVVLFFAYDGIACEDNAFKAVPECCHSGEAASSIALTYLLRCSCPAAQESRF